MTLVTNILLIYFISVMICVLFKDAIEVAIDDVSNGFLNSSTIHLIISFIPIVNTGFAIASLRDYFAELYANLRLRYLLWKLKRKLKKLKRLPPDLIELIDQL